MDQRKYIGMDVHQASISIAVRDSSGKLVMDSVIETKATTVLGFIKGLNGSLWVTFEGGTSTAWLYDLLKPHVTRVIVCDPRRNALLKAGHKNDRVDARKLSELLRAGLLKPVYHGGPGVRTMWELGRSYLTLTKDLTRVMNRLKGLYRNWAIPCAGQQVYSPRHRAAWLEKLCEPGVRRRAEWFYEQLDTLVQLRREARKEFIAESQKHPASQLLRDIPRLGPIRAARAAGDGTGGDWHSPGLAGAAPLTHVMASLLFGVSATDATTFGSVTALLAVVALAATVIPARRANRVDPMVALREE
jgi:transposase